MILGSYLGDFTPGKTIRVKWHTADQQGASVTATSVTVKVYKDGATTTETTTGVTHTEDADITGLHDIAIDTSADGTFYSAGSDFFIVVTAATVNGVSVTGLLAGQFSLANRSALRPTTADQTLDVSAGGEAGLDWANIGSPTTAQNLSATNIDVDQVVASVSGSVGSVASFGTLVADVATAVWGAGTRTLTSFGTLAADVWAVATRVLTAGTNIVLAKGVGVTGFNDPTVGAIADQVWEETLADHSGTVGSTAEALGAAGAAGDPWATQLPGLYGPGSAGKIIGDNIDAPISDVKSQTDKLTFDVDNALDANLQKINDTELTGDGTVATPWGPV